MKFTKIYKNGQYEDLSNDKLIIEMDFNEYFELLQNVTDEYNEKLRKIDGKAKVRWVD